MSHLLFKGTLDFSDSRAKDTPLLLVPQSLIVGIEPSGEYEIIDIAYLIQYPFIDGFGFVKGEVFRLGSAYTLINFSLLKLSKLRILPLRKQPSLTVSIWDAELL